MLGFTTDFDGHVTSVTPGSPADVVGLAPGDKINPVTTAFRYRRYIGQYPGGYSFVAADAFVTLSLEHRGTKRTVTMLPQPFAYPPLDKAVVAVRGLAGLIFILVAAALVLLRPSPMTWGFMLYAVAANPGSTAQFYALLPAPAFLVQRVLYNVTIAVGYVGFLWFALRFPRDRPAGWRRTVERFMPYIVTLLVARAAYSAIAALGFGVTSEALAVIGWTISAVMYFAGLAAFVSTYVESDGEVRQRIKWVIFGFAIGFPAFVLAYAIGGSELLPTKLYWLYGLLLSLEAVVPLTVAYAIIRHRVIDVGFFISRALVYAILTSSLVAIFGLIDWLLGQELAAARVATIVSIAAAIALGFWLDALQKRINHVVDAVFFRRRTAADRRIMRSAAALPYAQAAATIDDMLVCEPLEAYELTSAALFRTSDASTYARACARGWPSGVEKDISADDPLVLQLRAEEGPLRLSTIRWPQRGAASGDARPAIAVPLFVRRRLTGFALYGAHAAGQDLDADEIRSISALAKSAADSYEHLESERLRSENAALKESLALGKTTA